MYFRCILKFFLLYKYKYVPPSRTNKAEREDEKMETMKTNLSETEFKHRLKDLTVPHKTFDRGYEDSDVFF